MRWCPNSNFAAGFVLFLALPVFFLSARCAAALDRPAAAGRPAIAGPNPRELGPLVSAGCLAQLYTTPFDAFRHFRRCIQAYTEYDPDTCDAISPGSYNITQPAKHGTISNNTRGPFSLGNGDCPGHTYNFQFAYYNWTDDTENYDCLPHAPPTADDTAACDLFQVDWVTPDGEFDIPLPMRANLAPRINGKHHVWWFNGEMPAGYDTNPGITLTAYPPCYTYTWTIVTGATEVQLSSPTANPVQVASLMGSTAKNDVSITVQEADGATSNPFRLTVKQPKSLAPPDPPAKQYVDMIDANFAYESDIHYQILDQFGKVLPNNVPLNEHFTAGVNPIFAGENWRRGANGGATVAPSDWHDQIQGETAALTLGEPGFPGPRVPLPQKPQTPLGTTKVYKWPGEWSIGSADPSGGKGVKVQTNKWLKFQDHARYHDVVSPP
jgi:hypothetical protein